MNNYQVVLEYLRCFSAGDIDGLAPLFVSDLHFRGPLHQYRSSEDYLHSLRDDPPERCSYQLLSVTEDQDKVSVFYEYQKSGGVVTIAQLFTLKKQKICQILLIFDPRGLAE